MVSTIRLKNRMAGAAGAPAALASGEMAWNGVTKTAYIGTGNDGSGNATSIVPLVDREISPRMYGAVGDGVTDDTTAMASFFTDLPGNRGVLDPGAVYRITSKIIIPGDRWVLVPNSATLDYSGIANGDGDPGGSLLSCFGPAGTPVSITSLSNISAGASLVNLEIWTATAHGLVPGQRVRISSADKVDIGFDAATETRGQIIHVREVVSDYKFIAWEALNESLVNTPVVTPITWRESCHIIGSLTIEGPGRRPTAAGFIGFSATFMAVSNLGTIRTIGVDYQAVVRESCYNVRLEAGDFIFDKKGTSEASQYGDTFKNVCTDCTTGIVRQTGGKHAVDYTVNDAYPGIARGCRVENVFATGLWNSIIGTHGASRDCSIGYAEARNSKYGIDIRSSGWRVEHIHAERCTAAVVVRWETRDLDIGRATGKHLTYGILANEPEWIGSIGPRRINIGSYDFEDCTSNALHLDFSGVPTYTQADAACTGGTTTTMTTGDFANPMHNISGALSGRTLEFDPDGGGSAVPVSRVVTHTYSGGTNTFTWTTAVGTAPVSGTCTYVLRNYVDDINIGPGVSKNSYAADIYLKGPLRRMKLGAVSAINDKGNAGSASCLLVEADANEPVHSLTLGGIAAEGKLAPVGLSNVTTLTFQTSGRGYVTREDFVEAAATMTIIDGQEYTAEGLKFVGASGETTLPGLPDVAPVNPTLRHWGVVYGDRAAATANTAAINAADAWCAARNATLDLGSGIIFFDGLLTKNTGWQGAGPGFWHVTPANKRSAAEKQMEVADTQLVAVGTFARSWYLPGASDMAASGATRVNPSARGTGYNDSIYKWPSFMKTDGTMRAFSIAIRDSAVGCRSQGFRVLLDFGGDDGQSGYEDDTEDARSDGDVDVGIWYDDAPRSTHERIAVVGHWRIAGRMIAGIALWDGTGSVPQGNVTPYEMSFRDCHFQGFCASMEQGSDTYTIASVSGSTITVPWADTMCLRDSRNWSPIKYNTDRSFSATSIPESIISVVQDTDPDYALITFDASVAARFDAGDMLIMQPNGGGNSHIKDDRCTYQGFTFSNGAMAHDQNNVASGAAFDAPSCGIMISGWRSTERVFTDARVQSVEEVVFHIHETMKIRFNNLETEKSSDIGASSKAMRFIASPGYSDNTHSVAPSGGTFQFYIDAMAGVRFPGMDWGPAIPVDRADSFNGAGDAGFFEPGYLVFPDYTGSDSWAGPALVPYVGGAAGIRKPGHPFQTAAFVYNDATGQLEVNADINWLSGVMTGTAMQSSLTDGTLGKILTAGSGGLVTAFSPPTISDLDATDFVSGNYRITTGGASGTFPAGIASGAQALVRVERYSSSSLKQSMTAGFGASMGVWERMYDSSGWRPWQMVGPAGVVGTVSQVGGVSTGAAFETGSNGNGEYERRASGWQVCTNGNAAITTAPAAFVGTITKIDGDKLWIGKWF